ncbi:MAG TPA: hypothetical protein PLX06_10900 [Fimbriimonadaceae bacterium]|nr:hypothetical protein [Fimbriimonadaceae bacterium]
MADWHHSPLHRLGADGAYIVTASTLNKKQIYTTSKKLAFLCSQIQELALHYNLELEAWAAFSNHYHLIVRPHGTEEEFAMYFKHLHANLSRESNRWDATPGRKVWFQYRDTRLTNQKSYLARFAYVLRNPVKHGLVHHPEQYPYCSAGWFARNARPAQLRMIESIKCDLVKIDDDFDVLPVLD